MPRQYQPLVPPSSPSSVESLLEMYNGSHRVKYHGAGSHTPYDFVLEAPHRPVDVSLVLPHFRARNQPLDHRLSMFVSNDGPGPIKAKVCRNFTTARSTKFRLEVYSAGNADITVWLPSDFKGHIHRSAQCKRMGFSSGFTNRIMRSVQFTQSRRPSVVAGLAPEDQEAAYTDIYIADEGESIEKGKWYAPQATFGAMEEDEVVVHTAGQVTFRMWDIHRGEPEARCKEACKRIFGLGWCARRSPEVEIDWDFLLDD